MKVIRDSVHNSIILEDAEVRLLDSKDFQRLRNIKQLGFCYLVYPGANHTRFEHSIGTLFLTDAMCRRQGMDPSVLRLSALLHDLGHLPFSHSLEDLFFEQYGTDHEKLTEQKIQEGPAGRILEEEGIAVKEVVKGLKNDIICGELGTDRMDYLLRDAYYTGVAYGVIDVPRLLDTLRFENRQLYVGEKGLQSSEALLLARYLMFPTVYYHHAVQIARSMLQKACYMALQDGRDTDFRNLTDQELLLKLEGYGGMVERIKSRRLYKRAVIFPSDSEKFRELLGTRWKDIHAKEDSLCDKLGLPQGSILIDRPQGLLFKKGKILISRDGSLQNITDVSRLVSVLEESEHDFLYAGVYCPEKLKEQVKKGFEKYG